MTLAISVISLIYVITESIHTSIVVHGDKLNDFMSMTHLKDRFGNSECWYMIISGQIIVSVSMLIFLVPVAQKIYIRIRKIKDYLHL